MSQTDQVLQLSASCWCDQPGVINDMGKRDLCFWKDGQHVTSQAGSQSKCRQLLCTPQHSTPITFLGYIPAMIVPYS